VLSASEIARGTVGALRFLRRDAAAAFNFDNTFEACLRSFRVMLLVAPIYALYVLLFYAGIEAQADEWEIAAVEALRYVVNWLLFPVIFFEIARRRGWLERYPRYIAALNWMNLPYVAVVVVGMAIAAATPYPIPAIVELALQALFFYWFLIATRLVLGVGWLFSLLLLVINWVPSLLLSLIVTRLLGLAPIAG
jgi:hypothetical protein